MDPRKGGWRRGKRKTGVHKTVSFDSNDLFADARIPHSPTPSWLQNFCDKRPFSHPSIRLRFKAK